MSLFSDNKVAGTEEIALGHLCIRPLKFSDYEEWSRIRLKDEKILRPVEPTVLQWKRAHTRLSWFLLYNQIRQAVKAGECLAYVIELNGNFIGQITIGGINNNEAWVGYWVDSDYAGHGIATMSLAIMVDYAFSHTDLHRITATYLPNNPASGRVLHKVGFTREGYLRKNLHINGHWSDHHLMALIRDDFDVTAVTRVRSCGAP